MSRHYRILVLHGPNLNLLGLREPQYYSSHTTLQSLDQSLQKQADANHASCICFQSNSEDKLISYIHQALQSNIQFILFNPAAFTHTSIALRDALLAVKIPFIEIHLSNIYARETFRHHSYFSDVAVGVISGFGVEGYKLALNYALTHLSSATLH